jgi:hypothetical protein
MLFLAKAVSTSPENILRKSASNAVPVLLTKPRRETVALAIGKLLDKIYKFE